MKQIYTILFSIFVSFSSFSQCEYLGGDMENFVDLTATFDESGVLPPGTIIAPEHHTSLFRLFTIFFTGIFLDPNSPEYQELWSFGFGFTMSDDAFTGDSALRIGGDDNINLSDLYAVNACTEIPNGFQFSYKHIGEGPDTLSVICLFDEGALQTIPETEEDIESAPAYAQYEIIVDSTENEYTTINIPIIDNDLGVSIDTVASFIIIAGNEEFFDNGGESYFLIDDISFTNGQEFVDEDGDGFLSDVDCDDTNADINPDATEIANNDIDEDCDGEALVIDEDMDGFNSDEDCDDTNADINPDATEIANNDIDEDCDGEALVIDEDMDGFNSDEDCDDTNADINPDATEIANNDIDEDCDGEALIIDEDMDGFNSDEDCDDTNADINPDATEIPDNDIDENCDDLIETTSSKDLSIIQINIAPNPAQSFITMKADEKVSYEIFDTNGKSIINTKTVDKQHTIDVTQLSSGYYMIRITDQSNRYQYKKVIIQ